MHITAGEVLPRSLLCGPIASELKQNNINIKSSEGFKSMQLLERTHS